MRKTAIIIHGSLGHPQENWFPWLKQELEKQGYVVFVPAFPTPDGQSYPAWLDILKNYPLDEQTILISHSTGPIFILNALQDLPIRIKAVFLVAPFMDKLGHDYFDGLNKTFIEKIRDWDLIKQRCGRFFVYYSDNDPYVPISASQKVAELLNADVAEIKNAGHFNAATGYTQFPRLLKDITQKL